MPEPDSDRILVKKDNLVRCMWCGTPESDEWITGQAGVFCSPECAAALQASRSGNAVYICSSFAGAIMLVAIALITPYLRLPPGDTSSVLSLVILAFICIACGIGGENVRKEGMKYQDRKDRYRDVSLLVCEYCAQTNPPSVTRCRYCGASLTKAAFSYETTPPWIRQKQKPLRGSTCPHCNAIYSYNKSNLQSDGIVRCQNCNKPFILPRRLILADEYTAGASQDSDS